MKKIHSLIDCKEQSEKDGMTLYDHIKKYHDTPEDRRKQKRFDEILKSAHAKHREGIKPIGEMGYKELASWMKLAEQEIGEWQRFAKQIKREQLKRFNDCDER